MLVSPDLIHPLVQNNILVNNDGHAVLCDFGLSAALQDDSTALTTSNSGVGCPRYLAPERMEGKPTLEGDIYAFGCVGLEVNSFILYLYAFVDMSRRSYSGEDLMKM